MARDGVLFAGEDAVEAAWPGFEPVLEEHHKVCPYHRDSWAPKEADSIIAAGGSWYNPKPSEIPGG